MKSKVQGEGDYESARRFNAKETQFVASGAVEGKKRRNLQPQTRAEADAVEKGKAHARLPAHEAKDAVIMKVRVSLRNNKHRG